MTNPEQAISVRLLAARGRMLRQACLDLAAKSALLATAVLVPVLGVQLAAGARLLSPVVIAATLGCAMFAGVVIAMARAPSLARVAVRLDTLAGTRDRFTTALALEGAQDAVAVAAREECGRFAAAFDPASWLRTRLPRQFVWLAVPLVCAALLHWQAALLRRPRPVNVAAQEEARQKSVDLRELAAQLQKTADPGLRKLAEEMRGASERIEKPQAPDDPLKNVLHELSALEAAVRAAQMESGLESELAALAAALKQAGQSNDAADAMQRGDFEKAAAQIEQAASEPSARDKLAKALGDALEKMQGDKGGEMARQMEQAAQSAQQRSQALQKLAEMLRQMNGGQHPRQSAGISNESAQQLLSMLQDMKSNSPRDQRQGKSLAGSFSPVPGGQGEERREPPVAVMDNSDIPGARPGSEHDLGTSDTFLGKEQAPKAKAEQKSHIEGVLGEGESLQSLVTAAGGPGRAKQRYRALYDAMAPAAEQSVARENIPPASRFFVRRYFETIRPTE